MARTRFAPPSHPPNHAFIDNPHMATRKVIVTSAEPNYITDAYDTRTGDTVRFADTAGNQVFSVLANHNAVITGSLDDVDTINIDGYAADYTARLGSKTNVVILQSATHKIEVELPRLTKGMDSQVQLLFRDGAATLNGTLRSRGQADVTLFGDAVPERAASLKLSKTATLIDSDIIVLDPSRTSESVFGERVLLTAELDIPEEMTEGDDAIECTLSFSAAVPTTGLVLSYEFVSSTAVATYGRDYTITTDADGYMKPGSAKNTGTITLPAGADSLIFGLQITDDIRIENDEPITLRLSGDGLTADLEVTLMVHDNDASAEIIGVHPLLHTL